MHGVACVGALNWDRKLRLRAPFQAGTSNPVQRLTGTAGGVAFNLARHLVQRGVAPVTLVSAWGDDPEGQALCSAVRSAGIGLRGICRPGIASGQYTAVLDTEGELAVALADMQVLDGLPEAYWQALDVELDQAAGVVADLNLGQPELQRLCGLARQRALPLALVAVSAPKMVHLPHDLAGVDVLLLNRDELAAWAGAVGPVDVPMVWQRLQRQGLKALVVTAGGDGVTVCESRAVHHLPAPSRLSAVDVTGAGDALAATTLHALWVQGRSLFDAVQLGQDAAAAVLLKLESA